MPSKYAKIKKKADTKARKYRMKLKKMESKGVDQFAPRLSGYHKARRKAEIYEARSERAKMSNDIAKNGYKPREESINAKTKYIHGNYKDSLRNSKAKGSADYYKEIAKSDYRAAKAALKKYGKENALNTKKLKNPERISRIETLKARKSASEKASLSAERAAIKRGEREPYFSKNNRYRSYKALSEYRKKQGRSTGTGSYGIGAGIGPGRKPKR